MKLFYDMLVPFMPDKDVDDDGKLIPSKSREAGRNAMIELSYFQRTGNLINLYNATLNGCIYAEVDLVDEILGLPEDLEIPNISINEAVDMCAKMLFKSINPDNHFDIDKFVALLLTSAHFGMESIQAEQMKQKQVEQASEQPIPDDEPIVESEQSGQISLDEVIKDE